MATTPPEPFIVKHLMWAHDLSMYSVIIIYITNEEKNVMETTYKTLPRRVSIYYYYFLKAKNQFSLCLGISKKVINKSWFFQHEKKYFVEKNFFFAVKPLKMTIFLQKWQFLTKLSIF